MLTVCLTLVQHSSYCCDLVLSELPASNHGKCLINVLRLTTKKVFRMKIWFRRPTSVFHFYDPNCSLFLLSRFKSAQCIYDFPSFSAIKMCNVHVPISITSCKWGSHFIYQRFWRGLKPLQDGDSTAQLEQSLNRSLRPLCRSSREIKIDGTRENLFRIEIILSTMTIR